MTAALGECTVADSFNSLPPPWRGANGQVSQVAPDADLPPDGASDAADDPRFAPSAPIPDPRGAESPHDDFLAKVRMITLAPLCEFITPAQASYALRELGSVAASYGVSQAEGIANINEVPQVFASDPRDVCALLQSNAPMMSWIYQFVAAEP